MLNQKNRQGFTIVELLIVIVVIAILAAITVVAYNGIQRRTQISAVHSNLQQAYRKIESLKIQSGIEAYPTSLDAIGLNQNASINYQYSYNNDTTPKTFCLTAVHTAMIGTAWHISNTRSTATDGPCSGHTTNPGFTNLTANPIMTQTTGSFTTVLENLHQNPGGANGTSGFGDFSSGASLSDQSVSSSWSESGTAYRSTVTSGASTNNHFDVRPAPYLVANQRYTAVYKILRSTDGTIGVVGSYPASNADIIARSTNDQTTVNGGEPLTVWVTFETTSSFTPGSGWQLYHSMGSISTGFYAELSDVLIYKGDYNPDYTYFSGNTPAGINYTYVWSGAENASVSRKRAPILAGVSAASSNNNIWVHQAYVEGQPVGRLLIPAYTPASSWGRYFIFNRTPGSVTAATALVKARASYTGNASTMTVRGDGTQGWSMSPSMNLIAGQLQEFRIKGSGAATSTDANFRFAIPNDVVSYDRYIDVYQHAFVEGNYDGPFFQ